MRQEPGLPFRPQFRAPPVSVVRPLAYAAGDAAKQDQSRMLRLGARLGVWALACGLAVFFLSVTTGVKDVTFLLAVPTVMSLLGLPMTVAGALRRRPCGWGFYFLIGLTCNAIALVPAAAFAVYFVFFCCPA